MKITWFAGSCFRLHIGGRIVVTDPTSAPAGVAPHELTSGADTVLFLEDNALAAFSPPDWSRRRPLSLIDQDKEKPFALFRFGQKGLFVDPPGESPLILTSTGAEWGHFADDTIVVLFGGFADLPATIAALCAAARPKLVAIAASETDTAGFAGLAEAAAGTVLQILEPGLALEIY
jgi:hypothetical protein